MAKRLATPRLAVPFFLFLIIAVALAPAQGQTCANSWPPFTRVTYSDIGFLSVIGPQSFSANIQGAAELWNSSCGFGHLPSLLASSGTTRGAGDTENNSILIVYTNSPAPSNATSVLLAEWDPTTNTIFLYDKPDGTPIAWDNPVMLNTIAH